MAAAGAVVGAALVAVRDAAKPGVSHPRARRGGRSGDPRRGRRAVVPRATTAFTGIDLLVGQRSCRARHPVGATSILAEGDLVSIDCGAILDGWHGDSAWTFGVGDVIEADELLSEATRLSMEAGDRGDAAGQSPHRRLPRHRAGHPRSGGGARPRLRHRRRLRRARHRPRDAHGSVPGQRGRARARARELVVGSALAIEPMLTLGTYETAVLDDDWTVVTTDGSRAAHWEHTVAVTEDGPRILTLRPATTSRSPDHRAGSDRY